MTINKIQVEIENEDFATIKPGVMAADRGDRISLKFVLHLTRNKTEIVSKREVTCQFGHEYLSLVHDVLALFMFSLITDWTSVALNCYR